MRLYYETTHRDRIGNRFIKYYYTDNFNTKVALKKAAGTFTHITKIWTEEQASDLVKGRAMASYL